MSGNKLILDTNAVIFLLKGHQELLDFVKSADWIAISIISKIEFLAFERLTEVDKNLFDRFLSRVDIVDLANGNEGLFENIVKIKQKYNKIKLPDAIIISSAIVNGCSLVTADKQLAQVNELEVINFSIN